MELPDDVAILAWGCLRGPSLMVLLDEIGALMKVQQKLIIVGQHSGDDERFRAAMLDRKRSANSKIVRVGPYSVTSTEK